METVTEAQLETYSVPEEDKEPEPVFVSSDIRSDELYDPER